MWERSVPARGAEFGLADPDQSFSTFVVAYHGIAGTAGPLSIHYTDADGNEGTTSTLVTLTVKPRC